MKIFRFSLCIVFLLTMSLPNQTPKVFAGYDYGSPAPDELKDEARLFIDKQISQEDRQLLEDIKKGLETMSQLNERVLDLLSAIPTRREDVEKGALDRIEKASAVAYSSVFGADTVLYQSVVELAATLMKIYGSFLSVFFDMASFAITMGEVRDLFKEAHDALGTYSDYSYDRDIYARKTAGRYPEQLVWDTSQDFSTTATNLANPYHIKELKEFFKSKLKTHMKASDALSTLNHSVMHYKLTWFKNLLTTKMNILISLEVMNTNFCAAMQQELEKIQIPEEAKMPNFKVVSIEVIPPEGKDKDQIRIADEITIATAIKNDSDITSQASEARLEGCRTKEGFGCANKRVPAISPGQSRRVKWKHTVKSVENTFTVMANYDRKAWENIDWDNKKKLSFNLKPATDLNIEFVEVPSPIYKNEEVQIKLRVKNFGNTGSQNPKVELMANRSVIEKKELKGYIDRDKSVDLVFDWTPKDVGRYTLDCEVYSDKDELDEANNSVQRSVEVMLHEHGLSLVANSLELNPAKPKVAQEASIYFAVSNSGQDASSNAKVYIDDKLIKSVPIDVSSESKETIGKSDYDKITWKVMGGSHKIKVELDTKGSGGTSVLKKTIGIQTLMPGVEGIDLVLDKKYLSYKDGKVTAKIYNRGNQIAKDVAINFAKYPSYMKEPSETKSVRVGDVRPHELKVVTADIFLRDAKLITQIDSANRIKEVDEKNNEIEITKGRYRAYEPPREARAEGPDLLVADIINLDRPLDTDETREITIVIGNMNLVEARSVKVEYEFWNLAVEDVTPSHGYKKGEKTFSRVPKEGTAELRVNYRGVYPAKYSLTVRLDPAGKIPETDETNNQTVKYFDVEGELTSEIFFS
ncbi:MAG: CARDB domain-containing protein, partial [Candidatus Omnitrophota bacterium]